MGVYNFRIGDEVEMAWGNNNNGLIDGGFDGSRERGVVVGRRVALYREGDGCFVPLYRVKMNGTCQEFTSISLRKREQR